MVIPASPSSSRARAGHSTSKRGIFDIHSIRRIFAEKSLRSAGFVDWHHLIYCVVRFDSRRLS